MARRRCPPNRRPAERPEVAPFQVPFVPEPVPVATSAEGCASGDCLPDVQPLASGTPSPAPAPNTTASATRPPVSGFQPVDFTARVETPPAAPVAAPAAATVSAPVAVTLSTPAAGASFVPIAAPLLADDPEELEPQAATPAVSAKDDPTRPLAERWRSAVNAVREASTRHGSSLAHARILWIRQGDVGVAFTKASEFHRTMVSTSGRTTVEKALSDHFGRATRLTIESAQAAEGAAPSLAEEEASYRQQREKGADQKVRTHPAVLSALRILGGEIEHIQVLEPERKEQLQATEPDLPDA